MYTVSTREENPNDASHETDFFGRTSLAPSDRVKPTTSLLLLVYSPTRLLPTCTVSTGEDNPNDTNHETDFTLGLQPLSIRIYITPLLLHVFFFTRTIPLLGSVFSLQFQPEKSIPTMRATKPTSR